MEAGSAPAADCVFVTERVPLPLLRRRDLIEISKAVLLEGGGKYYVDAHGIWFVESEALQRNEKVPFSGVQWVTATPPKLPTA